VELRGPPLPPREQRCRHLPPFTHFNLVAGDCVGFLVISNNSQKCEVSLSLSQPNDAGANKAVHQVMTKAAAKSVSMNRFGTPGQGGLPAWNKMFVACIADFASEQNKARAAGTNNIISGWRNVGLDSGRLLTAPFWEHAIATLGALRSEVNGTDAPAEGPAASWVSLYYELKAANVRVVQESPVGATITLRQAGKQPLPAVIRVSLNKNNVQHFIDVILPGWFRGLRERRRSPRPDRGHRRRPRRGR
jgi:hypothetical protein